MLSIIVPACMKANKTPFCEIASGTGYCLLLVSTGKRTLTQGTYCPAMELTSLSSCSLNNSSVSILTTQLRDLDFLSVPSLERQCPLTVDSSRLACNDIITGLPVALWPQLAQWRLRRCPKRAKVLAPSLNVPVQSRDSSTAG